MAKTIIHDKDNIALWGDKDHLEVAQNKTFTELVFELLSEREPNSDELKLFELILNLSIDHGPDTPSAVEVIKAAKEGEEITKALSEGLMQIGDVHGGAAEPLMEWLYKIKDTDNTQTGIPDMVNALGKVPGFGHRIYKDKDARAELILEKTKNLSSEENKYILILELTKAYILKEKGKDLPINIDGAIAAALCTMNFEPIAGKAVFVIARTPGLIGQYLNNKR